MILIDTNIFLEVLLQQDRYKECELLLERVRAGELKAAVSRFSIYSIELIMARYGRLKELKTFLTLLSTFRGLIVISTTLTDDLHALEVMERFNLDFDDALHYYLVKKYRLDGIVSFDRHFDKTDIKRLEPKDLLKASG